MDERGLGGTVGEEIGLGDEARNRTQVDDRSARLLHVLDGVFRDHGRADHVRPERLPPVLNSGRKAFQHERRGIVDEDIEPAKSADGGFRNSSRVVFARNVSAHKARGAALRLYSLSRFLAALRIHISHHNLGALLGEQFRRRAANPRARSRYDGDFIFQSHPASSGHLASRIAP